MSNLTCLKNIKMTTLEAVFHKKKERAKKNFPLRAKKWEPKFCARRKRRNLVFCLHYIRRVSIQFSM